MKRSLLLAAAYVLPLAFGQAPPKKMTAWVDPVKDEPSGSHYKIFHSKLANTDWSFLVYLPSDYETSLQRRYPAIYPAAIVFMLNGLGESCWSDSKDGAQPVESMIVQELIPYFDRMYRTIPRREARAIEGHSMCGMGALHLRVRHSVAFEKVYGSDPAYFHENTVWTDTERNASKLRSGILIRIVVGDKDAWVYQRLQDYHDWLGDRAFDIYNKVWNLKL